MSAVLLKTSGGSTGVLLSGDGKVIFGDADDCADCCPIPCQIKLRVTWFANMSGNQFSFLADTTFVLDRVGDTRDYTKTIMSGYQSAPGPEEERLTQVSLFLPDAPDLMMLEIVVTDGPTLTGTDEGFEEGIFEVCGWSTAFQFGNVELPWGGSMQWQVISENEP